MRPRIPAFASSTLPALLLLGLAGTPASGETSPLPAETVLHVGTPRAPFDVSIARDHRLYNTRFGSLTIARTASEGTGGDSLTEAYPPGGGRFVFEPSLRVVHADGNTSTDLVYVSHESSAPAPGVLETRIALRDPAYPLEVVLVFKSYADDDIIEQHAEIRHAEAGPIVLERFASASPQVTGEPWLTHFSGDWANEMNPQAERLTTGMKVIDSKIVVRADRYRAPHFLLSQGGPARENAGEVWAGMLDWSGSFQLAFENDGLGSTRVLAGMNPYASAYHLDPGRTFKTPVMRWCWSDAGVGDVSRKLHRWVRHHALRDGDKPRAILLNNWEATFFDFTQEKLISLFDGAKEVGLELFLLDDGWFGNQHPRNDDSAGLGDWEVNHAKLPKGLSYLADEAIKRGLRFGIWIEPEMVNLKSNLYEQHPDWVVRQPKRELEIQRNQLVLDLTRPEVRAFQLNMIDTLLRTNPGITYVKWDSNRFITQPGSPWLAADRQGNFQIDHVNALYALMDEVAKRHPGVEMMLCSGGGGRIDFGSLKNFHEFWPSDNTDPVRRVRMQWDYSTFFPAISISGHVTRMGERPHKFAFDVAMSVRLGMDVDLAKFTPAERKAAAASVALYKNTLRDVVQFGDLYRLESPYAGPRAALNYVSADGAKAVLFVYQLADSSPAPVVPQGLDAKASYRITELNLEDGTASVLKAAGTTATGAELLSRGIVPSIHSAITSQVILFERLP